MASDPISTIGDGIKDVFLAGVGALAIGADKSRELVGQLIDRGALTVEQGKELNDNLVERAKDAASDVHDAALKAYMAGLSAEDRQAFVDKVNAYADQDADDTASADTVKVDAEGSVDTPDGGLTAKVTDGEVEIATYTNSDK